MSKPNKAEKTNGSPAYLEYDPAEGTPVTTRGEYLFTPQEGSIIRAAAFEAQAKSDALQALIRLVLSQQGLQGNWQLRQDGNGLVQQQA